MKKIIIFLLCCGVHIGMVGCGGNTVPPPTESPLTTISEMATKETPPVTMEEPTEKENKSVPTESKAQATEPTVNTAEEKVSFPIEETMTSTTPQPTESETRATEPIKGTAPEPDTSQSEFDIQYWISFAKEYAISIGLSLDSAAIDCWDNPIGANSQCIYLERDIKSRLNRYAKDKDITDVWIWTETTGNICYDIYIGYA